MIRFLRAFLWLRWRLFAGSIRAGLKRGRFEAIAAVLRIVVPIALLVFLAVISTVTGGVGYKAGLYLPSASAAEQSAATFAIRAALFVVILALMATPVVRSARGTGSSSARLLLLPISRRSLHACELAAATADPWLLAVMPALLLLALGLGQTAGAPAGLVVLASSLLFLAALGALASLVGQVSTILLRDRRRAELTAIAFLFTIMVGGMVAVRFVDQVEERDEAATQETAEASAGLPAPPLAAPEPALESVATDGGAPEELPAEGLEAETEVAREPPIKEFLEKAASRFPVWLQFVPSEAHARVVSCAAQGRPLAALPSLAALMFVALVGYGASWRLWRQLIESPEGGSRRVRIDLGRLRLLSLPFVSEPVAAVAFTTYRTAMRTVRGKLAVVMTPTVVGMITVMNLKILGSISIAGFLADLPGSMMLLLGFGIGLLAVQPIVMNQFACDGAGLSSSFLGPLSEQQLLRGKAFGGFLLLLTCSLPCALIGLLLLPPGPLSTWLAVVLAGLSAWFLYAPLGAFLSILLPKDANLSSIGQAGEPHPGAALLGSLGAALCLGPGALLVGMGRGLLGGGMLVGVTFGWMLICLIVGRSFMHAASGMLAKRRETLTTVASGH